jgi:transcriptional regulator with XRE-family HTH domain
MSNDPGSSNRFGGLLREKRLAKGLTLRKFAEQLGVSPTYVSGVENGTLPPPTFDRIEAISKLLEVPVDELMEHAGRWDDMAKQKVEERPEFVRLFRAVKDLSPEQIEQVTKLASQIGEEDGQ